MRQGQSIRTHAVSTLVVYWDRVDTGLAFLFLDIQQVYISWFTDTPKRPPFILAYVSLFIKMVLLTV